MKKLVLALSLVIVLLSAYLCQQIITVSLSNQELKKDYAELNHVKYGMFSVNSWKKQISKIIADEINKLYLTNSNERVLKKLLENQLNTLIDGMAKQIRESNKGTTKGWIKQSFINTFVDMDELKKGIPEYADALMIEMTKEKTEDHLKSIVLQRINDYLKKSFDSQDLTELKLILKRTNSKDMLHARIKLDKEIAANNTLVYRYSSFLIALSFLIFALAGFGRMALRPGQYFCLILTLVTLLVAGVTTSMIDMEAKISQISFVLMDHPVHFENQVLFFQSKSILDVFWVMITHEQLQMKLVGLLLVTFSILFPVIKLISSMIYYFDYRRLRENAFIQFFVLKSGKWSMADVLVVAIFMAYIGFNGIITSQFGHLASEDQGLVILTTNGTSLRPGYYLFFTYSMLGLFLSTILTKKPYPAREAAQNVS